jgi:hypothetical protein
MVMGRSGMQMVFFESFCRRLGPKDNHVSESAGNFYFFGCGNITRAFVSILTSGDYSKTYQRGI